MTGPHWSIAPVSTGGSTAEPVSVDEAIVALRLSDDPHERGYLEHQIRTARAALEAEFHQVFIRRQFDLFLDGEPPCRVVTVPVAPLVSVDGIVSFDADQAQTAMSSSSYYADTASQPGRVALARGASWPTNLRDVNGIRIRMTLGHSTASSGIPDPIRQAMLQLVAFLTEHRGEAAGEFSMPPQVSELMAPYYIPEVP